VSSCLSRSVGSLNPLTVPSFAVIVEFRSGGFGGFACGPLSTNLLESMYRRDHAYPEGESSTRNVGFSIEQDIRASCKLTLW